MAPKILKGLQQGPKGIVRPPLSSPHNEDRDFSVSVDYTVGNAAQDRSGQDALPVGTHNNEIGLNLLSFLTIFSTGCPSVITVFDDTPC
jgi:hypothetical protein